MAEAGEAFYRDVARAGYRARYFVELAERVAAGDLDLEAWGSAPPDELDDDELYRLLLGLPGVGPYAAAHTMMMMGRYSRLILDSWTRPTYAALVGRKSMKDSTILRRFSKYGPYAGLAFWLLLTERWVEAPDPG
jgi:N-glycosylase/DNA lyase